MWTHYRNGAPVFYGVRTQLDGDPNTPQVATYYGELLPKLRVGANVCIADEYDSATGKFTTIWQVDLPDGQRLELPENNNIPELIAKVMLVAG